MNSPLYNTDRKVVPVHIPWYRQSSFYGFCGSVCVIGLILLLLEITKDPPSVNMVRQIAYERSSVKIKFDKETIAQPPEFAFDLSDSMQYILTIPSNSARYNFTRRYDYGVVDSIQQSIIGVDSASFIIYFNTLNEIPEVVYNNETASLDISFNSEIENKFVVLIDPGHGGSMPGAVGKGGVVEKEVALEIAKLTYGFISERKDIRVILTRQNDKNVSLEKRRRLSNFWNADMFLSIHANSAPNRSVNQPEVYYSGSRGRELARHIINGFNRDLGIGRGSVKRRGFYVIRRNRAPLGAVLIETLYLSNNRGEELLKLPEFQQRIAKSIARSIESYIISSNEE